MSLIFTTVGPAADYGSIGRYLLLVVTISTYIQRVYNYIFYILLISTMCSLLGGSICLHGAHLYADPIHIYVVHLFTDGPIAPGRWRLSMGLYMISVCPPHSYLSSICSPLVVHSLLLVRSKRSSPSVLLTN